MYGLIKDYYDGVGTNTPLFVLPVSDTVKMSDMLDKDQPYIEALMVASGGDMRLLGASKCASETDVIAEGLDEDVALAMRNGQASFEKYRASMRPFRFVVDAKSYNGNVADLKDYNDCSINAGSLFLTSKSGEANSRIGLLLGALSKQPVQRKISRVKNGAVGITYDPYIGNQPVEVVRDDWDTLHDKGYIFLRSFPGKSGYFFSSDRTATATNDDYASLSNARVIDKAVLIAYSTYVNELGEELQLTSDGKISPPVVKNYQGMIENAITSNMNESISNVTAEIDPQQNILSNNQMVVSLKIVPVSYLGEIVVNLGFDNPNTK
ncbi:hypothetical protein ElyMa_002184900 [Elysia marginata]|uniref:DUF2586 family protein n=1 Tax=Elysia marginata TaxID=1093978 RepID=A0AAV4FPR9_9GAST|nr:hypothetical protein ElyMa_002184900 [Elysia marginata]